MTLIIHQIKAKAKEIIYTLSNSFGFGGNNGTLLIKKMINSGENYMLNKTDKRIDNLQKTIKYYFKNRFIIYSFITPSYAHENNLPHYKSNQRLNF